MTHEQMLWSVSGGSIGLIALLVGAILGNFNTRIKTTKDMVEKIRDNYLNKFEEIKTNMNQNHIETINAINNIEKKTLTDFVAKSECYFKHKD